MSLVDLQLFCVSFSLNNMHKSYGYAKWNMWLYALMPFAMSFSCPHAKDQTWMCGRAVVHRSLINLCKILKQPNHYERIIRFVSPIYLDQANDEILKQPLGIPHSGTSAEFHLKKAIGIHSIWKLSLLDQRDRQQVINQKHTCWV